MTYKELIKEEIERLKDKGKYSDVYDYAFRDGNNNALDAIARFIDSLPEEPVSEDLEEEMIRWHKEHFGNKRDWEKTSGEYLTRKSQLDIARHFAEWQRNKDAVPSCKNLYDAIKEEQEKKNFHDDFEKASYAQGMIDGSIWQKQQMIKNAVEGEVRKGYVGNQIVVSSKDGIAKYVAFDASYANVFCVGDKVKIIIVKEN